MLGKLAGTSRLAEKRLSAHGLGFFVGRAAAGWRQEGDEELGPRP